MMDPNEPEKLTPKEGIVLDSENRPLLDPTRPAGREQSARSGIQYTWRSNDLGWVPKVVFGTLFLGVFILGLTFTLLGAGLAILFLLIRRLFRSLG